MKDEPLDIIPMIILLGIVVAISMNIMIPLYRGARELRYSERYDKAMTPIEGEMYNNSTEVGEGYNFTEMVLLLAKQTYFMPQPRVMDIGGSVVEIQPEAESMQNPNESYTEKPTEDYIPDSTGTAERVRQLLYNWCVSYTAKSGKDGFKLKFNMVFTVGDREGGSDDCYMLCVAARQEDGKTVYLKCLPNGEIETKPNLDYEILYST